jgi:hypothetical protein
MYELRIPFAAQSIGKAGRLWVDVVCTYYGVSPHGQQTRERPEFESLESKSLG